jgi:hypothetical protein
VVNATLRPIYSLERPGTHYIGGWVGLRAGLEMYGKSRPPPGFDPRTVQLLASRYTDYAIPALRLLFLYKAFLITITDRMCVCEFECALSNLHKSHFPNRRQPNYISQKCLKTGQTQTQMTTYVDTILQFIQRTSVVSS